MADFYNRTDFSAITNFTDAGSKVDFGFEAFEQTLFNEGTSGADTTFEVSWDGTNVHARLSPSGPTQVIAWSEHQRRVVWIRRVAGGGVGAKMVQILANTR